MTRTCLRPLVGLCFLLVLIAWPPAHAAVEDRVEALLARMTLDEKVGQLNLLSREDPSIDEKIAQGRVGAAINFNNAQDIARAQELARRSRLQIPLLFGLDVLHGFRTAFPLPLGEAAAFNPTLSRLAAEWAAREASYIGVQWTYAPMADLSRDVRWGRMIEGFGEDPHLGSVLTAARVQGFQAGGLATTAKHFVGYGAPMGGRDYDSAQIPRTELRDLYLPPFRAAVEAGSESVMTALNGLNGVPSAVDRWLLTDILRREWGFDGFVTSDWAGIHELLAHGVAADEAEAARKAILAGVDMDMVSGFYDRHLAQEVRAGRLQESVVDEAVRRVLRVKFRLGLFERPGTDPARVDAIFPSEPARRAAREVARESMVLLQNRGALPIAASVRSIAVVGPLADAPDEQLGPHAARGHGQDGPSFLAGLRDRAAVSGVTVAHAAVCDLTCQSLEGLPAALEAARGSDLVVAVFGEPRDQSGEAASRARLTLSGRQAEALQALAATGKPVVLVLMAGRPLELGPLADAIAAVLMAWYPGTEGGTALADLLFGDVSPSGKLPVSYPRTVGQVPIAYNHLPTGRPTRSDNRFTLSYHDEPVTPLFPFGWGLSYTTFTYSEPAITKARLTPAETLEVETTVTNTGARAGQEVVQLYVRDPVASRSRPVRELKAFDKIALAPGESRRVTLRVPVRDLGFHLEDGTYVVEPGLFQVFVGGNSLADRQGRFEVTQSLRLEPNGGP